MAPVKSLGMVGIVLLLLVACGPAATTAPTAGQEPAAYPLAENGPYHVGMRTVKLEDGSRGGRQVSVTVWYPAVSPADSTSTGATRDAEPDSNGAPYSLVLSSTKLAALMAPVLVSHGFTWASVDGIDSYPVMRDEMYNQPLDILFALNYVASSPPEALEGLIDAERAGVIGYSFDGFNALALSGARVDPEHYLRQCPNPEPTTQSILSDLSAYNCGPAREWDAFVERAGAFVTLGTDGLWEPMTDPRIRAVMPLAAEGWWLFGEQGLAAVDRPVLMISGTKDPLYRENALIFEYLGTTTKTFISFIGWDHYMIYSSTPVAQMAHFAVAFIG